MWKTIFGRCIYQSQSGIQVHQNLRYRWLTLGDGFIQTLISRKTPSRTSLQYIGPLTRIVQTRPGTGCLLGLGGAGILHALSSLTADAHWVAVENNREIIEIAHQYFKLKQIQPLDVHHQNAEQFVATTLSSFQHLIVDLHDGKGFPETCHHESFFKHCKNRLDLDGIMAVNVIDIGKHKSLFENIRNQFQNCTLLVPVKGSSNTIIFAFNIENTSQILKKIRQIGLIKHLFWDHEWGLVGRI